MDLISQIVATKDNVEATEVQNDLEKLFTSTESVKRKMKSEFNNYDNLLLRAVQVKSTTFIHETRSLLGTTMELEKRIKELMPKDGLIIESKSALMFERIQYITNTLIYLQKIEEVESLMKSVEDILDTDCLSAAQKLMQSKTSIDKYIKVGDFNDFFKHAVECYCEFFATLKMDTCKKWNEMVAFKHVKRDKRVLSSTLTISMGQGNLNLNHVFQTLQVLKLPFSDFQHHLFTDLLNPVLNHSCCVKILQPGGGKWSISIDYTVESPTMSFENVVYSLIKIFKVINAHLDLRSDDNLDFIQSVGLLSCNQLENLFIEKHLSKEIKLDNGYDHIIHLTKELLAVIMEKRFIIKDNKLSDYIASVQSKYETRIFSKYMETASTLMKKELLDLMHIKAVVLLNPMPDVTIAHTAHTTSGRTAFSADLHFYNASQKDHLFPECQISKSVDELVKLIEEILSSIDSNAASKARLCQTVREIIYMYLSITQHQPCTPQHAALVYNNSMYLIVSLIQIDMDCKSGMPFAGLINKLQNMAFDVLNQQMVSQQSRLNESLHKSGLGNINEIKAPPEKTDDIIGDSLLQFTQLQDAWINILPTELYCITMGHLCSGFIEDMLLIVLSVNQLTERWTDISSQYLHLFSSVSEKITQIFKEKSHLEKYVKSWGKLHEVCRIFGGTLTTVKDRWDGGTGPLTAQFTNLQIRSLITAIFPPSESRVETLEVIL